jgi:hypothetical protein
MAFLSLVDGTPNTAYAERLEGILKTLSAGVVALGVGLLALRLWG